MAGQLLSLKQKNMLIESPPEEVEKRLRLLLEQYGHFLRSAITKLCPHASGVQVSDIEQEARVRLWRALQAEREIADPASYLYRIASTATIDAIRRVKARREEQLLSAEEEDDVPVKDFATSPLASPERQAQAREIQEKIAAALTRLSDDRRRAVGLHLKGFTTQEIANYFAWTEPKARNLVYRGLGELRQHLLAEGMDCEID